MCTIAHGHLSNSADETIEMSERVGATRQTWLKSKQVGHLGRFLGGHLLCSVTWMFMFAQVPESCCILQGPRRDLVPADNGCVTGPNRQNSYFNKVARDMCRNSAISANWFFWLNFSTNPLQIWFSSIHPERLCSLFLRVFLQGCYNKFVNSVKNNQVEMLRPVAKKAFVYRSLQLFSWTGT